MFEFMYLLNPCFDIVYACTCKALPKPPSFITLRFQRSAFLNILFCITLLYYVLCMLTPVMQNFLKYVCNNNNKIYRFTTIKTIF